MSMSTYNGEQEAESQVDSSSDDSRLRLEVRVGSALFQAHGDGPVVLEAFAAFRDFYEGSALADESSADRGEGAKPDAEGQAAESSVNGTTSKDDKALDAGATGTSVPLPVFLGGKKLPRGNHAIALGIAVWAKRYKDEQVITPDSVKAHWRNSGRKIPANIPRDLGSAASEGWLERLAGTTGNYSLTTYGETQFDGFPASDA
jgi:hypothetical protein